MSLEVKLRRRSPAEVKDMLGLHGLVGCVECDAVLGKGWPLWGLHLTVALNYHAAHWLVTETRDVPATTPEDRLFGRHLAIVDRGQDDA